VYMLRFESDTWRLQVRAFAASDNLPTACTNSAQLKPEELFTFIQDNIHFPVFYFKDDVSETWLSSRLEVEPTQFSPLDRADLYFRR
jgi:hypothetical protein